VAIDLKLLVVESVETQSRNAPMFVFVWRLAGVENVFEMQRSRGSSWGFHQHDQGCGKMGVKGADLVTMHNKFP
jgi:hypothetical protein